MDGKTSARGKSGKQAKSKEKNQCTIYRSKTSKTRGMDKEDQEVSQRKQGK